MVTAPDERGASADEEPFGLISEIDADRPSTWEGRFFLTLDVDWAPDFVITEVDELLRSLALRATWFVTHESEAIGALRSCERYEIGVHPNFSPGLMGAAAARPVSEVIAHARELAPSGVSFRNHSLVQSSPLLDKMFEAGFNRECNLLLPYTPIEALRPWRHYNGMTRIPYCWDDYLWLVDSCRPTSDLSDARGLRVINVHPIHLWLNSESLERYERVKPSMRNEGAMRAGRNDNGARGVAALFAEVISQVMASGVR